MAPTAGCGHARSMTAAKLCACFLLTLGLSGCAQWVGGVDAANEHAEAVAEARAELVLAEADQAADRESQRAAAPPAVDDRVPADQPAPEGGMPEPPVKQGRASTAAYWACFNVDSAYTYSEDESHWDRTMRMAFVSSHTAAEADEQWAPLREDIADLIRTTPAHSETADDGFEEWLAALKAVRRDCKEFGRFPRLHNEG